MNGTLGRLEQVFGAGLFAAVLLDVFLTVLYARMGTSIITGPLARVAWRAFRAAGPVEIPKGPLDRLYNWDRVAQALLDGVARHPAVPPAPAFARPHCPGSGTPAGDARAQVPG